LKKLKQLFSAGKPIPALLLVFGIILAFNGVYYMMRFGGYDFSFFQNETIILIPNFLVGSLLWIIGGTTAGINYLLYNGKLTLQRSKVTFEREKTNLFWAGLIILSLASLSLFSCVWSLHYSSFDWTRSFLNSFPQFLGLLAYILIGLYMMKSGVKRIPSSTQK
jgi:hypothetical protein